MTVGARGRGPKIHVVSPADGRLVGEVDDLDVAAVATRLTRLRAAQAGWEETPMRERVRWVRSYQDWLLDNQDRLHLQLQQETGKPWGQAAIEVSFAVHHLDYYARLAERQLAEAPVRRHSLLAAGKRHYLRHRPYPLVGVISPWNFPVAISLIDSVPALLAGAAVALKPSEATPLAVSAAVQGWSKIGAPDVFTTLTGGPRTGEALVAGVDYVQFTGSTRTGRAVAVRCAERLIPCSLELGGKDPMIVLAGADLDRAAHAAVWGGMANSGQMCTSVERIYVEQEVYDPFVARVVAAVRKLRVGHDDHRGRYDVGPLATPAQVELVRSHLADAVGRGARVLVGGTVDGAIVRPTVLVDVDHTMRCLQEETFGPLLPIMAVASPEEALQHANSSAYGLSAHVFGPDRPATHALARRVEVGSVNINDVAANLAALVLPQSGWRQSGLGGRNGAEQGLLKYCRSQAVVEARWRPRREPIWFPYSRRRVGLTSRLLRFASARDVRRRLGLRRPRRRS